MRIVETLKEFKGMFLGYRIEVFTDHLNLVHETTLKASDRVMRQKLLLEEFGIKTTHVKGEKNVVADAISRLPFQSEAAIREASTQNGAIPQELMCSESLLQEEEEFPLSMHIIHKHQQRCRETRNLPRKEGYKKVTVDTLQIIHS